MRSRSLHSTSGRLMHDPAPAQFVVCETNRRLAAFVDVDSVRSVAPLSTVDFATFARNDGERLRLALVARHGVDLCRRDPATAMATSAGRLIGTQLWLGRLV